MKTLKFRDYLVPVVLSGEKTSTWRLFDDKDLSTNNTIELREFGRDEAFATARITHVIEKPFAELTSEDRKGHETFSNDQEMYETYSMYYKTTVTPDTLVKIIWFELL